MRNGQMKPSQANPSHRMISGPDPMVPYQMFVPSAAVYMPVRSKFSAGSLFGDELVEREERVECHPDVRQGFLAARFAIDDGECVFHSVAR